MGTETPERAARKVFTDIGFFALLFTTSAILPGPDTLLVFTRALSQGFKAAILTGAGLAIGKLILLSAVSAGSSLVSDQLANAAPTIRLLGCVYLVWLATKMWIRAGSPPLRKDPASETDTRDATIRSQLATKPSAKLRDLALASALTISNPQALFFYVAVVPTVTSPRPISLFTYVGFALSIVAIMFVVTLIYATLGSRMMASANSRRRFLLNRISAVLIGLIAVLILTRQ